MASWKFTSVSPAAGRKAPKKTVSSLAKLAKPGSPMEAKAARPKAKPSQGAGLASSDAAGRADAVYAGVAEPLTAGDVADTIVWAVTRPPHVNVDLLVIRPRAQAAQHKVHREQ